MQVRGKGMPVFHKQNHTMDRRHLAGKTRDRTGFENLSDLNSYSNFFTVHLIKMMVPIRKSPNYFC